PRSRRDAQEVAEADPRFGEGAVHRRHRAVECGDKRYRADEMRRRAVHEDVPLAGRLPGDAELTLAQIAQTAVSELAAPAARSVGQVAALDEHRLEAARRRIERHAGSGDTATDDHNIDGVASGDARHVGTAARRI